jgi:hypothetical protein
MVESSTNLGSQSLLICLILVKQAFANESDISYPTFQYIQIMLGKTEDCAWNIKRNKMKTNNLDFILCNYKQMIT